MKFKQPGRTVPTSHALLAASLMGCIAASATEATYQYYRYSPVKLRNDATSSSYQLSEFQFLHAGAPVSLTGVVVTNPGGNNPAAEKPENLIDGNPDTKHLDFHKTHIIFTFPAPVTIDGYRWTTGGDANERDALRWTLEGSADGISWTLLDHQATDYATPTAPKSTTPDLMLPATPVPHIKTWTGNVAGGWSAGVVNWNNGAPVAWDEEEFNIGRFAASANKNVTIDDSIPVYTRLVNFTEPGYVVSGGLIFLHGVSGIQADAPAEIKTPISTTGIFVKTGSSSLTLSGNVTVSGTNPQSGPMRVSEGTLIVTGTTTYNGRTAVAGGTLQYSGSGSKPGTGDLMVGTTLGKGVVKIMDTSTVLFDGTPQLGAGTNASGVIRQSGGTATLSQNNSYVTVGSGGGNYGMYDLSGGTSQTPTGSGYRIGGGGIGILNQSGGNLISGRWFAVGANSATSIGLVNFTGGTMQVNATYRLLVGDGGNATVNVGTMAGGNAKISPLRDSTADGAVVVGGGTTATGVLNLNSGELNLKARIYKTSGTGILNLNGGTLKSGLANVELLNNTLNSVRMYKGGVTVDTNGFASSISAVITQAAGNGVYVPGGSLPVTAGGSGYIGSPLVAITGGSGTGVSANADVTDGVVTGVTFTCPGQNYQVGDTLTFTFTHGGATTAATTFEHVLTAAEVASNSTGALVKTGAGTLTLSAANTYAGDTTVNAGTLSLAAASLADASKVTIASGAILNLASGASDTIGSLVLGGTTVPTGTYGATHPTYGAYFSGTGSLIVGGSESTYGTWATEKGLTAANNGLSQDPDGDGKTNLLEYFLDGNPLAASGASTPVLSMDDTHIVMIFSRRDDAESFVTRQVVQYGSDLTGWTDAVLGATSSGPDANGVSVMVSEDGAMADTIVVRIPKSLAGQGKLFARVKVTK